jgi:hypothetical protein
MIGIINCQNYKLQNIWLCCEWCRTCLPGISSRGGWQDGYGCWCMMWTHTLIPISNVEVFTGQFIITVQAFLTKSGQYNILHITYCWSRSCTLLITHGKKWPQDRWPLKRGSIHMKFSMTGQENVTLKYRWLLNRGDHTDRLMSLQYHVIIPF